MPKQAMKWKDQPPMPSTWLTKFAIEVHYLLCKLINQRAKKHFLMPSNKSGSSNYWVKVIADLIFVVGEPLNVSGIHPMATVFGEEIPMVPTNNVISKILRKECMS